MEKIYFADMPLDKVSTCVAAVMGREERQTKTNSSFVVMQLSDGKTTVSANLWSTRLADVKASVGGLITVRVYKKTYNGGDSYEVQQYGPAPKGEYIGSYIPCAPYNGEEMYKDILSTLRKAVPPRADGLPTLADMVERIYAANHDAIVHWAAAKSVHHAYMGGLMYHVFRMMRTALCMLRVYGTTDVAGVPPLNAEVLLAGVALHDIGKLVELETNDVGASEYTPTGNLFGHTLLGIEMVNAEAARAKAEGRPYDEESVRMLKHCIAAHHGRLDFGAIVTPATREAFILNAVDDLDAKMFINEENLKTLEEGAISGRQFGLNGGFVYKMATTP